MAFRTVVGQDYKAKNALDAFIESRENKARTETKISNSALQNVGQAAVMASDAFSRTVSKGWVMAQKTAWAVKQMQIESNLASSGMEMGMKSVSAAQGPVVTKIVRAPLQPMMLSVVSLVGSNLTVKWGTKLSGGNSAAAADALMGITQAQVMIDGKFRPQSIILGLDENHARKLELTVDLGEPGLHAIQIRNLDSDKWSQWSEALSVDASAVSRREPAGGAKLSKKKATKGEGGIFARALSAGNVPAFLMQSLSGLSDGAADAVQPEAGDNATPVGMEPKQEDRKGVTEARAGEITSQRAGREESPGKDPIKSRATAIGRTISAPAQVAGPAFITRRFSSAAQTSAPDDMMASVQDSSLHHETSPAAKGGASANLGPSRDASPHKPRIAPSRAKSFAASKAENEAAQPSGGVLRALSAPENDEFEKSAHLHLAKSQGPDQGTPARGRLALFRRAASKVTAVLRVSSTGKNRPTKPGHGQGTEDKEGDSTEGQGRAKAYGSDIPLSTIAASHKLPDLGLQRAYSAPEGEVMTQAVPEQGKVERKGSWHSAFSRIRSLPKREGTENDANGLSRTASGSKSKKDDPDAETILCVEVHMPIALSTISGIKEAQIKLAVAGMAGVGVEVLSVDRMENAGGSTSRVCIKITVLMSRIQKMRLRVNKDRLNLELRRANLPNAKGIKEIKAGSKPGGWGLLSRSQTVPGGKGVDRTSKDYSEFKKLMSSGEDHAPAKMDLSLHISAAKHEVMLMYDSLQEGINEVAEFERYKREGHEVSVTFVAQTEAKASRLIKAKVTVSWRVEAPAGARDHIFAMLTDSDSGLRKWAEKKGLPETIVGELTIAERQTLSLWKRAGRKASIITAFANASRKNSENMQRCESAPTVQQTPVPGEQNGFTRTPSGGVTEDETAVAGRDDAHTMSGKLMAVTHFSRTASGGLSARAIGGFAKGGFTRTPSAPDQLRNLAAEEGGAKGDEAAEAQGIEDQIPPSPGMTTEINQNNLAITRTSSGGVYVKPAAQLRRKTSILGNMTSFFLRAESAEVKSDIAYQSSENGTRPNSREGFRRAGSHQSEDLPQALSGQPPQTFFRRASSAVSSMFSRAGSSSGGEEDVEADRFLRPNSRDGFQLGDTHVHGLGGVGPGGNFSRASSAEGRERDRNRERLFSTDLFARVGSSGEDVSSPEKQAGRAGAGSSDIHLPDIHRRKGLETEDGPRTPIMHIEPQRLYLGDKDRARTRAAYQKPTVRSMAGHPKNGTSERADAHQVGPATCCQPKPETIATAKTPKSKSDKSNPKSRGQSESPSRRGVRRSKRRNGHGSHTWSSGERYEGEWEDGVMHGKGIYYYADDFKDEDRTRANDRMHRYEGEFVGGKFNGNGQKHMSNGDSYDGGFQNGKFHGRGTYFSQETGETYIGGFWKGRFHGRGVQVGKDGHRQSVLYDAKRHLEGAYD